MIEVFLVVLLAGLTAYALFGGADFGAGWWDLFAGGTRRGHAQRKLIEHAIGPVWEANHVWLIFTIVLLWTGFPSVFAAIASTMYIPLTVAALGIIGRGAGFAFRKTSATPARRRVFGAGFAFSSVATPFFLGAVAGGVASGRVPPGIAAGDLLTSWWNPTSIAAGLLAVGAGAYLAAVFLTRDAQRSVAAGGTSSGDASGGVAPSARDAVSGGDASSGDATVGGAASAGDDVELVDAMRRRALVAGGVVGLIAAGGLVVVTLDAPWLADRLFHGLPLILVVASALAGLVSLVLLWRREYLAVRITAGLAAAAILWAWGLAQYPYLLPPSTTVTDVAAHPAALRATLISVAVGAVILVPSLWWLLRLFQTTPRR